MTRLGSRVRELKERWLPLARREVGLLAAVLLLAGGLWGFAGLAEEVLEGETRSFDRAILLGLRTSGDLSDPIGPVWFEEMARDITSLGGFAILGLLTLVVIGYLVMAHKRATALLILGSVGGGLLLSTLLKNLFERARPDLVPHATEVYTASFPSGHAMLSAVTYLTLGSLLTRVHAERRLKLYVLTVAILISVLVGLSRVYLGVHWPTDVLAGWCVGAAWAMLCWLVALWLQRRGQVEAEEPALS
jgi:undecaprenyl-diphosphatase